MEFGTRWEASGPDETVTRQCPNGIGMAIVNVITVEHRVGVANIDHHVL